jgi:hypothetical protein
LTPRLFEEILGAAIQECHRFADVRIAIDRTTPQAKGECRMSDRQPTKEETARHATSGKPDKLPEKHGTDVAHGVGHKYGSASPEPPSSERKKKGGV